MKKSLINRIMASILSAALLFYSVPVVAYSSLESTTPEAAGLAILSQASSQTGSCQLVRNPGFEHGNVGQFPDGWSVLEGSDTANGSAVVTEDAAGVNYGKRSLKFTYSGTGMYGIISDPMAVSEGMTYRLNLHSKGASGTGKYSAYLNFYDESGKVIGTSPKYGTTTSSGWSYITTNTSGINAAVAPAGAVTARYVLSLGGDGSQTNVGFYFDGATLICLNPEVTSVYNGGFEEGMDENTGLPEGYDVWEWTDSAKGTVELTKEKAYKGQYSAKLSTSKGTGQNSIRSGLVAVEPNVSYNFNTYTYALSGSNPVVRAHFYTKDGADLGIKDYTPVVSGAWVRSSVTMVAPSNAAFASVMIYQNRQSDAVAYVDEISIVKTADDHPEEPIASSLQNAGFETGVQESGMPTSWTKWPSNAAGKYTVDNQTVHNGNGYNGTYSMKITDDSSTSTAGAASDPVQVTVGKKYRATAWVYNQSGSGVALYVNFYRNREDAVSNSNRLTPVPNVNCAAMNQWTQVSVEGVAPADAACATVGFYSGVGATTVSYVDDTSFEQQPDAAYYSSVPNPSFEAGVDGSGIPNFWTKLSSSDNVSLSSEKSADGTHSAKLINTTSQGCGLRSAGVTVTPGVTYQASSKIYCDIGSSEIYLEFWNAAGSRIDVKTASITRTKQWVDASAVADAPAGAAYATLLYYQNSGNQGIMYCDCASIAAYTPPAENIKDFPSVVSSHPKVLFTANDISALKKLAQNTAKSVNGVSGKEVADNILGQAKEYLAETEYSTSFSAYGTTYNIVIQDPPVIQPVSPSAPDGYSVWPFWTTLSRGIQNRLEVLSMAYILTGDKAYARKAIDFAVAMSGWDLWHDPKDGYPKQQTNLDTAHLVQGVSMAYDACYDQMTADERTKVCNAIIHLGLKPLYTEGKDKIDYNIQALRNAALATGALAIKDDVDSSITNRCLTRATDYFEWYLNEKEESGNQEGFGYTSYALENMITAFDQLARVTGQFSLIQSKYLNDTLMKWILGFSVPGTYSLAPVSDFDGGYSFYQTCTTLAKNGNEFAGWYISHAKPTSSDILAVDEFFNLCDAGSIKMEDPSKLVGNSSDVPEVGWGALRTGWNSTDSVLGLISNNSALGHNHYDQNSFLIGTNGMWIASDPGYSTFVSQQQAKMQFRNKVGHNTILVDWEKNTTNGAQVFKGGGSLTANVLTPAFGYLTGSAAASYGVNVLSQYDRHAIMVNHAGRPYYVLFDELNSLNPHTYTWSLFTNGWDSLEVDGKNVSGVTSSQTGNMLKVSRNSTDLYAQFIGNEKLQIDSDMFTINNQSEGPYIHVSNQEKAQHYNFMAILNTGSEGTNIPASVFQPTYVASAGCSATLSGGNIALFRGETGVGSNISYSFEVPEDGDYSISLFHPTSYIYGIYQMSIDGTPCGQPLDGYSTSVVSDNPPFSLGTVHLTAGTHIMTATCTGTSVPTKNKYFLGITKILLKKTDADAKVNAPIPVVKSVDSSDVLGAELAYSKDANDILLFSRNSNPIQALDVSADAKQASLIGLKADGSLEGIGTNQAASLEYQGKRLLKSTAPVSAYIDYLAGTVTVHADKAADVTYRTGKGLGAVDTVHVAAGDTTVRIPSTNASVTPLSANYDKYAPSDIQITKDDNGNALNAIKNGNAVLSSGKDYSISGDTVTIKQSYLSTLPVGKTILTFSYSGGTNPTVTVNVSDSTPPSAGKVTVSQPTEGGTISISPSSPVSGDTVTLTAKAKDGYRLKAFVVNGKEIAGNTFTMSNGNVIVTAEFEKIGGSSSVTTSGFGQSPKTGDSSLPSLWLALLCGSLAGLSWLIARRKMRSSQN